VGILSKTQKGGAHFTHQQSAKRGGTDRGIFLNKKIKIMHQNLRNGERAIV
jgi:hypothetical protein